MIDMSKFIMARSDQLNADDLIDAPRTITITKVTAQPDAAEQPVSIHYEGGEGRPWKPCKTARRILVGVWGKDASKYVGRSMTLYRDPTVAFGGMQVGGIRVSHMSDISEKKTVALQVTRGRKAPFTIQPLVVQQQRAAEPETTKQTAEAWTDNYVAAVENCAEIGDLMALQAKSAAALAKLKTDKPDLHTRAVSASSARAALLQEANPTPTPQVADPLAPTLKRITDAPKLSDVDAIDKETESDRTFLTDEQVDRLDEALAIRRSELRATVQESVG